LRKILSTLILLIIAVFLILFIMFSSPADEDTLITISKNSRGRDVAGILAENNIIRSQELFLAYLKISNRGRDIIPGEFLIPKNTNLFGVVNYITNPRNIYCHKITLVEGQTVKQFLQIIESNPNLIGDVMPVKEGTMMPDTYCFARSDLAY
jgi:cell division protein YceG involved in septum cleavage